MNLRELHSCIKSEGKIVMISTNNLGITFCGYCNKKVDYTNFFLKQNLVYCKEEQRIIKTLQDFKFCLVNQHSLRDKK